MRVAIVHPFAWPEVRRGAERYLDDLGAHLAGAGHQVEVVTGTTGTPGAERREDGVVVRRSAHRVPPRLARRGVGAVETFGAVVLSTLLRLRYDVVHAFVPSAALAARLAGQRVVYTMIGHPSAEALAAQPAERSLAAAAIHSATAVTALSASASEQVRRLFGRHAQTLPPGVRLERFPPRRAAPEGPPRLLMSADVSDPRKGVDVAIAALAHVRAVHPAARLVLSGSGDHRWALARLGAEAIAATRGAVVPLGQGTLEEVPGRYRAATVTVLPARQEAFGLALVESLASGTPVVCSREGGMAEIVDRDDIGRTHRPGDACDLARALLEAVELAADPNAPARCAAHARRWGWAEAVGPAHEELYRRVAATSRLARTAPP